MQKNNKKPADGTRILIVRLSAIGDVLHATAVVHNLKRIYPNCHLTWLVSPPADILLKNNPDIFEEVEAKVREKLVPNVAESEEETVEEE